MALSCISTSNRSSMFWRTAAENHSMLTGSFAIHHMKPSTHTNLACRCEPLPFFQRLVCLIGYYEAEAIVAKRFQCSVGVCCAGDEWIAEKHRPKGGFGSVSVGYGMKKLWLGRLSGTKANKQRLGTDCGLYFHGEQLWLSLVKCLMTFRNPGQDVPTCVPSWVLELGVYYCS